MKNYANPPIPDGYEHICGEWNNGFVIERQSDGSQFVWVPVGSLKGNERKQDAESIKKYGEFYYESVKKYGGFYISRFNISKSPEGKPQSVKGELPWVWITFDEAMILADSMEQSESIESHLTFDEEYDLVLKWFVSSHATSYSELYEDSSDLGNYWDSKKGTHEIAKTGSCEEWCLNEIYDFAGNIREMTNDFFGPRFRGGSFDNEGYWAPASSRSINSFFPCVWEAYRSALIGFRVVLYIK